MMEELAAARSPIRTLNQRLFYVYKGHPLKPGSTWLGNAFAIGPTHCLTAKHLFRGIIEANLNELYLIGSGLMTPQKSRPPLIHPTRDVALLSVDPGAPHFTEYYALSDTPLAHYCEHPECSLHSCGYVAHEESAQTLRVNVTQYNGEVSAYGLTGYIQEGKSGGCLLNNEHDVVGVVFASDPTKNNHYAIAVDSFRDWLLPQLPPTPNRLPLSDAQQSAWRSLKQQETLDVDLIQRLQSDPIRQITAYRLKRYATRSKDPKLDALFVNLVLLLDCGQDNEQGRFQPADQRVHQDLSALLQERPELALVLIGRPGNGKTTLLRHLELQLCHNALTNGSSQPNDEEWLLPFYVELNQYPPKEHPNLTPLTWLSREWEQRYPELPPLTELMRQQPVILLLDALNEMKVGVNEQEQQVRQWRALLKGLKEDYPQCRALFTCRTMDYSTVLSDERDLPVPQIKFQELSPDVITAYFQKHLGEAAGKVLADALLNTSGLELKTPYYLALSVDYYRATGRVPKGASELIASMIWLSLRNEYDKDGHSVLLPAFLTRREKKRLNNDRSWIDHPHTLPQRGPLMQGMVQLAWSMGGGKELSKDYDDVIEVLLPLCEEDEDQAENLTHLLEQLDFLELTDNDYFKFSHQLLQEYLAAHALINESALDCLHKPWEKGEAQPDLRTEVEKLGPADPLPKRQPSYWEETAFHGVAITQEPWPFIQQVQTHDLVLAARCAQHPEISDSITPDQKQSLEQALRSLSQNPQADLRARLEAGLELGRLGDSRFTPVDGEDATYIPPPMAPIPAGRYHIGSEDGREDERPVHAVELDAFAIGQYPITNAEWRCFMDAGGYEDERWWPTEQAALWQQGKLENTETIEWFINRYRDLTHDFEGTCTRFGVTALTREHYHSWLKDHPTEEAFSAVVREQFKPQCFSEPGYWHDPNFNNPVQPVVGICWYEALAYCHWLTAQTGRAFALPTEGQWKAAASGQPCRRFPWGDQPQSVTLDMPMANTLELHLRRTTPVGLLAEGATPSAETPLYDLAGNVCEWSCSLYRDYPIQEHDGRDDVQALGPRILNGGAWYNPASYARAAYRPSDHPSRRDLNFGFRVVCVPPS